MKIVNLANRIFGRLTVDCVSDRRSKSGDVYWRCVCLCGNTKEVVSINLKHGKTQSCGCLSKELAAQRAKELFTKPKTPCSVHGCENDTSKGGHGYCGKHAQRYRRYGNTEHVTPQEQATMRNRLAQLENKQASKNTYRKFYGNHEHRVIAEQMAGRNLLRNEHVHHIDGDKHNNDPSNLMILSASDHAKLHAAEKKHAS